MNGTTETKAERRARLVAALEPHRRRPIRAFLADPAVRETDTETAFWDLVYPEGFNATHDQAKAVELEMTTTTRRVAEVIDGWRPHAIGGAHHGTQ